MVSLNNYNIARWSHQAGLRAPTSSIQSWGVTNTEQGTFQFPSSLSVSGSCCCSSQYQSRL